MANTAVSFIDTIGQLCASFNMNVCYVHYVIVYYMNFKLNRKLLLIPEYSLIQIEIMHN